MARGSCWVGQQKPISRPMKTSKIRGLTLIPRVSTRVIEFGARAANAVIEWRSSDYGKMVVFLHQFSVELCIEVHHFFQIGQKG